MMIEFDARATARIFPSNSCSGPESKSSTKLPHGPACRTRVIGNILFANLAQARFEGTLAARAVRMEFFAVFECDTKPTSVTGPLGCLTIGDLPSSSTTYWVSRHKAEVLAAIEGGLLSVDEACERYRLSLEEIVAWRRSMADSGVAGLRITKDNRYRHPL